MDKHSLELLLAQGFSIERIAKRFGKDPSTVGYWVKKHGLSSPYADKHAAKGGIERERLEELVERGMTIAEIATEVGLSKGAVRHWLRRHGLRTKNRRGRRAKAAAQAKEAGVLTVRMTCAHHGETEFALESRGYYRCKRCRAEAVTRRRRRVKEILVAEAGGACVLCGYDRCPGALEFHHLDPLAKRMPVSADGNGIALETLRAEARKCVLVCSNCHVEIERGISAPPATVPPADAQPDTTESLVAQRINPG
jgi:transposase